MKFTDYTVHELQGKMVLWVTSERVINHHTAKVLPIKSTTNRGFKIFGEPNRVFDYFTGYEKSVNNRSVNRYSKCRLITERERRDLEIIIHDSRISELKQKYEQR